MFIQLLEIAAEVMNLTKRKIFIESLNRPNKIKVNELKSEFSEPIQIENHPNLHYENEAKLNFEVTASNLNEF